MSILKVDPFIIKYNDKIQKCIDFFHETVLKYVPPNSENMDKTCVAGGSVRDYIKNNDSFYNDIDIYFLDYNEHQKFIAYMKNMGWSPTTKFKSSGKNIDGGNYVALQNINHKLTHHLDIIHDPKFKSIENILESFDFSVARAAVTRNSFYCSENFFKDIEDKKLRIESKTLGHSIIYRIVKYTGKGFIMSRDDCNDVFNSIKDSIKNSGKPKMAKLNGVAPQFLDKDIDWDVTTKSTESFLQGDTSNEVPFLKINTEKLEQGLKLYEVNDAIFPEEGSTEITL